MCTKLEKDTLYGVHKVIPTRANNDLWPLKINKGRPLIMDNIYIFLFPNLLSGKDVFNRVVDKPSFDMNCWYFFNFPQIVFKVRMVYLPQMIKS